MGIPWTTFKIREVGALSNKVCISTYVDLLIVIMVQFRLFIYDLLSFLRRLNSSKKNHQVVHGIKKHGGMWDKKKIPDIILR